jgi:hypothetical protein
MSALARIATAGLLLRLGEACVRLARRMLPVPPEIEVLADRASCDR